MKLKFASFLLAACALVALPLAANASLVTYSFNLDGSHETPPNASSAAGSAQLTFDDVADTLTFALAGFNLLGVPMAAHIHFAPAGVKGPPVYNLGTHADSGGPLVIGSFVIPNSFGMAGEDKSIDAALIALINATPSNFYVNLHTTVFPGGIIRGQLAAVPLPPAVWLLGSAFAGLGVLRRRNA